MRPSADCLVKPWPFSGAAGADIIVVWRESSLQSGCFYFMHRPLAVALILAALPFGQSVADALVGAAFIQQDGTIQVRGRDVQLYGIYIPSMGRACQTFFRPVRCSSRAALALDFKIQGFVHCEVQARNRDGSVIGQCYVDRNAFSEGEDLSAYLISMGWASALPNAPYEYHVLEKVARHRGLGMWGFPVDSIQ